MFAGAIAQRIHDVVAAAVDPLVVGVSPAEVATITDFMAPARGGGLREPITIIATNNTIANAPTPETMATYERAKADAEMARMRYEYAHMEAQ